MSAQEVEDLKAMGWACDKELGSGHFAKVRLVTCTTDEFGNKGIKAAAKIIKKPKEARKRELIKGEHKILTSIDNEYVVKCYDAFETEDKLYLILELMEGGELFDRIVDMGHFTEAMAIDVVYKLFGAMKYMHDKGIAHRDLKPENMLMTDKSKTAQVKITDFGLSKFFDEQSSMMKTPCGTPGYIAPEVLLMKGYDMKCDVWSMGVITYILLCGFPPFYADNDAQLFEKIKKGEYQFLKPYWDPISDGAKNFIRRMLVVDPKQRASFEELLKDDWLKTAREAAEKKAKEAAKTEAATEDLTDKMAAAALNTTSELAATSAKLKKLKGTFLAAFAAAAMESSTPSVQ